MADTLTPEVLWAQRSSKTDADKNFIYLTISVPDVPPSNLKLDLKSQSLTFTGHSDSLKKTYHLELEFYAEIDPEASKVNHTGKNVELKLHKKELKEEYWPRLLKDSKKVHFLRTDFDKWVDEDEQNEAAEDDFSQFGGMGGMPGMGAGGDFGGIDFSKLGGGAGGAEEEEEEDDDDMPPLEGEEDEEDDDDDEEEAPKAAGKAPAAK
ncbi:putative hsp90 associated co-chaperone protein [Phaeoacremonium minimum UCRPA7]|uniref:Putative hsp90 associated co-chaperone protein n=1 Tax=Phaeoacremonium minimum (strain UCR-PA7) TaxID=1286976 RepID=R8BW87_PHAM7|nr:putative hsp90 associated co-chaperone protein [Phaeoacremonium minimum UCRPA7]EOO03602.1 putative hsp90 associated co-chaperone protein [Phaeoacremonium minimum UCRPA7]